MIKADAEAVAEIHCETLAGDFLPCLGKSFLETLYKCVFRIDAGFGIVYEKSSRIVAVAVATEDAQVFFSKLLLNQFWLLIPNAILPILKQPSLIKHVIETFLHCNDRNNETIPKAELMTLCISKAYQRKGIGKELLLALSDECKRRGINSFALRVYADNTAANNFYMKAGFELCDSYIMYGRKWNVYTYKIK
jgi:ribosomal protein S18 acetylase RimI-like enzyme